MDAACNNNNTRRVIDHYDRLARRIVHVLSIYPQVSPSMLQVGLGPGLSAEIWRPVLEQLLLDKVVKKQQISHATPAGRSQVYTILSLS